MYYSGIDLLKIISMLSIISHHILLHGGILNSSSGAWYAVSYFLETMCCYGVNAYTLTTGFLSYQKKHSFSKYLLKWFEVAFGVSVFRFRPTPWAVPVLPTLSPQCCRFPPSNIGTLLHTPAYLS